MNCNYVSLSDFELTPRPQPISQWGGGLQPHQFCYLSGADLEHCRSVNKQWRLTLNPGSSIWGEILHRDFCPPLNNQKERNYQVLYKQKACIRLNIKNNLPQTSRKISILNGTHEILVNNYFLYINKDKIFIYRISPYQLERTITSSTYRDYPPILNEQKGDSISENVLEYWHGHYLKIYHAGGDLFFSKSEDNSIVSLWDASTGNCLFSKRNISSNVEDDVQLVDDLVIYTTDRPQWTKSSEVQVWDYKKDQLVGGFRLPIFDAPYHYRHHLKNNILVSENGIRIIGHHLETKEKLYEFSHPSEGIMQMEIANDKLLIYHYGANKIDVYHLEDGSPIHQLPSGILTIPRNSKQFLCYKNYCITTNSMRPDHRLLVWNLENGELINTLGPFLGPFLGPYLLGPFIIHHDRLIAHYAYIGGAKDRLFVWNLKDFSVLINEPCEQGSLHFIDDHLLAVNASQKEMGDIDILFWDILKGKFLGSKGYRYQGDFPSYIGFLNGKMYIKESGLYDGFIVDFFVYPEPKPEQKPKTEKAEPTLVRTEVKATEQKTLSTVKSIFCCFK